MKSKVELSNDALPVNFYLIETLKEIHNYFIIALLLKAEFYFDLSEKLENTLKEIHDLLRRDREKQ